MNAKYYNPFYKFFLIRLCVMQLKNLFVVKSNIKYTECFKTMSNETCKGKMRDLSEKIS